MGAQKWLKASIRRQFYVAEFFQVFFSKNRLIERRQISVETPTATVRRL
jgi:hypothetical protein